MQFPYAINDFGILIREGYFYQDRTDRISQLEKAGRQLIFIRPRRFGKSLLLSMLEQYLIMKWDFSLVNAEGSLSEIKAALYQHVNDRVTEFAAYYAPLLTHPVRVHPTNAVPSLESARMAARLAGRNIYLLADECDNFANDVLVAQANRRAGSGQVHGRTGGAGTGAGRTGGGGSVGAAVWGGVGRPLRADRSAVVCGSGRRFGAGGVAGCDVNPAPHSSSSAPRCNHRPCVKINLP